MVQMLLAAVWAVFISSTCSPAEDNPGDTETSLHDTDSSAIAIEKTFQEGLAELQEFSGLSQSDSSAYLLLKKRDIHSSDSVVSGGRTQPSDAPDLCQNVPIDTFTTTKDGNTYVFKDEFYWKIVNNKRIADGYPRTISEDWDGLPGCLDASFSWPNGATMFFKGRWYWRFTNKDMDPGYPKLISERFEGIPDYLDAAVVLHNDPNPYFFKGRKYWKYDAQARTTNGYPKDISDWEGLPNYIDAAFRADNDHSYFFKDDVYYRIDEETMGVDRVTFSSGKRYPLQTADEWFGC